MRGPSHKTFCLMATQQPTGGQPSQQPSCITLVSVGSRGDVVPYINFGLALQAAGHKVRICCETRYRALVEDENQLEFGLIYGDSVGLIHTKEGASALETSNLFKLISLTKAWDAKFSKDELLASYVSALAGSDVIITGGLSLTMAMCVAEYMRVPCIPMILGPTVPTADFPIWPLASIACCACMNSWTYRFLFRTLWSQEKGFIQPWRHAVLGLPPWELKDGTYDLLKNRDIIIACSAIMCPAGRPRDYGDNVHMRGFIPPPIIKNADPSVVAFIAAARASESKLVYMGFGSMPCAEPSRLLQLAVDVCKQCSVKAVLLTAWAEEMGAEKLSAVAETICIVHSAPHDWLFPQMDCLVHHCGIGTTAAALRSGVPQVPCPFGLDQPHNARQLVRLHVAPCVVPYSASLSAAALGRAVGMVLMNEGGCVEAARAARAIVAREEEESADAYVRVVEMSILPRLRGTKN